MNTAAIALGSNLNFQDLSPKALILKAFDAINALPQTQLLAKSRLYLTEPVNCAVGKPFINAAALVQTSLPPQTLLGELLKIEAQFGRKRSFINAPRSLDLDLLIYRQAGKSLVLNLSGGQKSPNDHAMMPKTSLDFDHPALILPHPRLWERAFVLAPLADIAGDWCAADQKTIAQALKTLDQSGLALLEDDL